MRDATKTWGPFTGRQLTTIVCVLAVLMLFPVGAWAVSFTNVAITDPGGKHRAKVGQGGKLAVGDGEGSLTVDGQTALALPAKPIRIPYTFVPSYTELRGPQTARFGITSLTVFNSCNNTSRLDIVFVPSTGPTVNAVAVIVGPSEQKHLTYPSPLVAAPPAGGTVAMYASPNFANCYFISGVGIQS